MKENLNTLFEERISKINQEKEEKRKRIYEVNKRYADTFYELVKKTLLSITSINESEEIDYTNSIIGEFNSPSSKEKSTAILTENGLEMTLYFNSNPYKIPMREKEYDESIINTMLSRYGITIRTIFPTEKDLKSHIQITYKYEKKKELPERNYNENRNLTTEEAHHLLVLTNIIQMFNINEKVILGLPKKERAIYIFKNDTGTWTVCDSEADFGLANPQFCQDIKRAISEVFHRLKCSKEAIYSYNNQIKYERNINPEYFCETYGYELIKEKRLT